MSDTSSLRLVLVGPGRAGGSMAIACRRAGHEIVGVLSRTGDHDYGPEISWEADLPTADLALLAVKDDAIAEVAERIAPHVSGVAAVAHMSGFVPVSVLEPIRRAGVPIGGFHPLQSMPDPESGADALRGSFVGIGGDGPATDTLKRLAASLGLEAFSLTDEARPAYHAAAAAAANFVVASLAVSADLFASAGLDPSVSEPLVRHVVANVFEKGARASLTGPIARGDIETVIGHLRVAHDVSSEVGRQFELMAEATAIRAGREGDLARWR